MPCLPPICYWGLYHQVTIPHPSRNINKRIFFFTEKKRKHAMCGLDVHETCEAKQFQEELFTKCYNFSTNSLSHWSWGNLSAEENTTCHSPPHPISCENSNFKSLTKMCTNFFPNSPCFLRLVWWIVNIPMTLKNMNKLQEWMWQNTLCEITINEIRIIIESI